VIYRKYYGTRAALRITGVFYLAMVAAGYVVELLFTPLGLVPEAGHATVVESSISWNYTTWLNLAFLVLAAVLLARFVRTGGVPMLKMMGGSASDADEHQHGDHDDHQPSSGQGNS
jgi:uncharacterized membrane protein YraQ (UPF0718 family)